MTSLRLFAILLSFALLRPAFADKTPQEEGQISIESLTNRVKRVVAVFPMENLDEIRNDHRYLQQFRPVDALLYKSATPEDIAQLQDEYLRLIVSATHLSVGSITNNQEVQSLCAGIVGEVLKEDHEKDVQLVLSGTLGTLLFVDGNGIPLLEATPMLGSRTILLTYPPDTELVAGRYVVRQFAEIMAVPPQRQELLGLFSATDRTRTRDAIASETLYSAMRSILVSFAPKEVESREDFWKKAEQESRQRQPRIEQ